jgi:replicative DNA helicase
MTKLKNISPRDTELERVIISNIVYKCPELNHYINELKPEYFYKNIYRDIVKTLKAKLKAGEDPSTFDIPEDMRRELMVKDLIDSTFVTIHFEESLKKLKSIYSHREIYRLTMAVEEMISKNSRPPGEIKNWLKSELEKVELSGRDITSIQDIDLKFEEQYIDVAEARNIMTGFKKLDSLTGGFRPGSYNLIAGDRSTGKSTFMLNMVNHICGELKKKILIVSLEMGYSEILGKLISINSGIDSSRILNPLIKINEDEIKSINNARAKIYDYRLFLDGHAPRTDTLFIEDLYNRLGGVDIIFIDYLRLLAPTEKGYSAYEVITNISRDLQTLSKRLNIPLVVISTLNRRREDRPDKRPKLSDLRDSGNIEYDIDLCLFLYRKALDNYDSLSENHYPGKINPAERELELIISKNRYGTDREIFNFDFDLQTGIFKEL